MSVRRLYHEQPTGFAFSPENLAWAKTTIAKYPDGKQASAVIPLLWRAQEQNEGWVTRAIIEYIAKMLDMADIRVLEVATFYTMFQLQPVGKHAHVQVCGTIACQLRGAEDLKKVCQRKIHPEPHHRSADGTMSWEEVECLGACVNAPMVQVWKDTYEDLTPEALEKLIDEWQAGRKPKPGSQSGRHNSMPQGGATALTDATLYSKQRTFTRVEAPPPPPPAPAAPAAPAAATPPPAAPAAPAATTTAASTPAAPAVKAAFVAAPAGTPAPANTAPKAEDIRPVSAASKAAAAQVDAAKAREQAAPAAGMVMTEKAQAETGVVRATANKVVKATAAPKAKPAAPPAKPEKPVLKSAAKPIDGRPELLKKARGKADDLKLIWGVGPALEKMLNKMGVWHFDQVASWSARELAWVDDKLEGFKGRAKRDEWIKQARKLAKGWRPDNAAGDKPGKK